MIEQQEVVLQAKPQEQSDKLRPTIIEWKKVKMIRVHSIRATVKEIIKVSESLDAIRVGIIGNPHTGKTTLALSLAHLIHKMSPVPFAVRVFDKDDLLNFEATLKSLKPANYVLVFDDVSFLGAQATKKQIEMVKQATTEIRHLEGGTDVKIISILNYHYTLGLDKYLRQAEFRYFTSVGSSEVDNMEKIVGSKYMDRVRDFQKMYTSAIVSKKFTFRIGVKDYFGYKYRDPFIPVLFYNNDTLRYVVAPTREWIEPICSICSLAKGELLHSQIPIEQFVTESEVKFGKGAFLAAVKLKLFQNGMNVYSPRVVQAARYLDRAMETKLISFDEVAAKYGLQITKTKLKKKLDGVLEEPSTEQNI